MDLQQVSVNCFNFLAFSRQRDALSCFTSHEKTVFFLFLTVRINFLLEPIVCLFFVSFCLLFLPIVKVDKLSPFKAKDVSWKAYFRFIFIFTQTVKPISSFRLIEVEKQGMEKLQCVKSD